MLSSRLCVYRYALVGANTRSNAGWPHPLFFVLLLSRSYVTSPTDTAAVINAKLSAGLHVVVTPGVYQLDAPLKLGTPGQVLLGLGLATLVSAKQNSVVEVGDVDGARVAGFILQAGPPVSADAANSTANTVAPVLLQWGSGAGYAGSATAPGFMHDIFVRVGGPDGTTLHPVAAQAMIHVHNGHVIGDNMWLWRADHAKNGPVAYVRDERER